MSKTCINVAKNAGNLVGKNQGALNQNFVSQEYKQQYYVHSAARISNYFSWVKFIVTISAGAIAATASTLFAVPKHIVSFQLLLSLSIISFLSAIIFGLLSYIGSIKYEESKSVQAFEGYCTDAEGSCFYRVSVDPWFSNCGNFAFFLMVFGFLLISSGVVVFWLFGYKIDFCIHMCVFLISLFFVLAVLGVLFWLAKKFLFHLDDEDKRIHKNLSKKYLKDSGDGTA